MKTGLNVSIQIAFHWVDAYTIVKMISIVKIIAFLISSLKTEIVPVRFG